LFKILCNILALLIVARAILSWFSPASSNRLAVILYELTEPFLAPLRRIVPTAGMFDFTPVLALIILQIIVRLLP